MQISRIICGFTASEADYLRKGVGKKKIDLVAKEKEKFIPRALERGHDKEVIERLWGEIETFARYGFNKSHSVGYGKTTYHTAYLKAHYMIEWMAALLTIKADNDKQVRKYVDECMRMSIEIRPPDVRFSDVDWVPEEDSIRYGLRSIMGISTAADKLVEIRIQKPFANFLDFIDRCHAKRLKQSEVDSLIRCGACDHWGKRLAMMTKTKERWKVLDSRRKKTKETFSLFEDVIEGLGEGSDMTPEEKQDQHITLLSGCYSVEVERASSSTLRVVVTVPSMAIAETVIEEAQRSTGTMPLVLGIPTQNSNGIIWMDIGRTDGSAETRARLESLGCVFESPEKQ